MSGNIWWIEVKRAVINGVSKYLEMLQVDPLVNTSQKLNPDNWSKYIFQPLMSINTLKPELDVSLLFNPLKAKIKDSLFSVTEQQTSDFMGNIMDNIVSPIAMIVDYSFWEKIKQGVDERIQFWSNIIKVFRLAPTSSVVFLIQQLFGIFILDRMSEKEFNTEQEALDYVSEGEDIHTLLTPLAIIVQIIQTWVDLLKYVKVNHPDIWYQWITIEHYMTITVPGFCKIPIVVNGEILDDPLHIVHYRGEVFQRGGKFIGRRFTVRDKTYLPDTDDIAFYQWSTGEYIQGSALQPPQGIGLISVVDIILCTVILQKTAPTIVKTVRPMINNWYQRYVLKRSFNDIIENHIEELEEDINDKISELKDLIQKNGQDVSSILNRFGFSLDMRR